MKQQELLDHWKDIVMAVFYAENAILERGEELNKDAEDKEKEADRWVTLVATEILSKQND
jgi:hypothetical protein